MNRGAIGVFDSGVGGLTVADRIQARLPEVPQLYFGDTAHVPYGARTPEEVIQLVAAIAHHLVEEGAEALVMACNTSSALALDEVRARCQVPVLGIIEAAAAAAVFQSRSGRIGLLANPLTAASGAYERAAALALAARSFAPTAARIHPMACPRLVPLVEAGEVATAAARDAVEGYLEPLLALGVDTLILGCTHYPFLEPLIREVAGPGIEIIDPALYVVEELLGLGFPRPGSRPAPTRYLVSGPPPEFERCASLLLGREIAGASQVQPAASLPASA